MPRLAGTCTRNRVPVEGAKVMIIDPVGDDVIGTAESDADGAWTFNSLDLVDGDLYDAHYRLEEGGFLYAAEPDLAIEAVEDPHGDLAAWPNTEFYLAAAVVAERREMAAADTEAFDVETEDSPNGYRVDQPTGGDRPTIRTDTGAAGGYWIIRGANDSLRVRDAGNTANIIGSDLMPTEGTLYAVFRCNDGGENVLNACVMGSQSTSKGICIAVENEIRCGGGDMGIGDYVVPGVEPTAALVAVIYKWNGTTIKARKIGGAWVSDTAGSGGDIAAALGAAFKLFAGSGGTANDMDICIAGVLSECLTDAEVDDAGGLADMIQAAWDASVAA